MKIIFIDECCEDIKSCSGEKTRCNLYICAIVIVDRQYSKLKKQWVKILSDTHWQHKSGEEIEFKSSKILARNYGGVNKETRIKIAKTLIESSSATQNNNFQYYVMEIKNIEKGEWKKYYCRNVPNFIKKIKKNSTLSKNLVQINLDSFDRNRMKEAIESMRRDFATNLSEKGFIFFEDINFINSTIYTLGIIYADLFAWLTKNKRIEIPKNCMVEPIVINNK